ncbi:hypothetical protein [Kitasatospora sp. CB01950]|uniref:hypothetical protein n=1 Tax=Kitasatospora sp. CB01950 TaxID=1703930 RepID=UPI00093A596D|nr:hypothetical protein [Kitasatospora sp. CB01950]OKJ08290.1 hypothetical protein AMK19_20005 [Kitasatospora sp. CB01950]
MRALEASLSEVLDSPGTVGAVVVDAVSGLGHHAVGEYRPLGTGAELAELAALIGEGLGAAGAAGELESLVVTTTRHHQVVQLVPRRGDPLLLATVLDRTRTNLALAIRQSADLAKGLLT